MGSQRQLNNQDPDRDSESQEICVTWYDPLIDHLGHYDMDGVSQYEEICMPSDENQIEQNQDNPSVS